MNAPAIEFRGVSKSYAAGSAALEDFSLSVAAGETLVLVGTSGSGKTTALKLVNRLVEPDAGEVWVRGRDVREAEPIGLRRQIGYVIQESGLFPHMTVAENVETVPLLLGWDPPRRRARARELLELVGLAPDRFLSRLPSELSGGQRQRVGVARALAADPPILLMDEPFGALDAITRRRLREEFGILRRGLGKTVLFVTHDPVEALLLGDRIAVMDAGRLRQVGAPREIQNSPADEFVKELMTVENPVKS